MRLESRPEWMRALFAGPCLRCGILSVESFCPDCRSDFVRVLEPCHRCGLRHAATAGPRSRCPAETRGWVIDELIAPFVYASPLASFLQALKYGRQRRLGLALGELLRDEILRRRAACDAIVVVPLHPARLRQRTFNQADEIARPVARAAGCRIVTRGVLRCRNTPPQATLGKRERLVGPERAFSVERCFAGLTLAIVDDVVTTGATMNALARQLLLAGAQRVIGLAVARSLGSDDAA